MAAPADYQIQIISPTSGLTLAIFDQSEFYSFRYERVLNGVGRIVFTIDDVDNLNSIFVTDSFIEIFRTHPVTELLTKEATYLTRVTHRFHDGDAQLYTVGGVELNHLIARRVINPTDDPLAANGFSTKSGPADVVIRSYAIEQMGSSASALRQTPNLTILPVAGIVPNVGDRLTYEDNLLIAFQDFVANGRMDFEVVRTSGINLELRIAPIGSDKTKTTNYPTLPWVGFSPERGNLTEPSLRVDRLSEKNVIFALGKGEGSGRQVVEAVGAGTGDSPFNRIEFATSVQEAEKGDSLSLFTAAGAKLSDSQAETTFEFDASQQLVGAVYQEDWLLGDQLTVLWEDFEEDLRVKQVALEFDSSGEILTMITEPA